MPPSPRFVSAFQNALSPAATVRILFDMAMDTGVLPAVGSFRVVVDGVPIIPLVAVWIDAFNLDLIWLFPDPAISGTVQLLTVDANLRSATGVIAVAPQEVTFFP